MQPRIGDKTILTAVSYLLQIGELLLKLPLFTLNFGQSLSLLSGLLFQDRDTPWRKQKTTNSSLRTPTKIADLKRHLYFNYIRITSSNYIIKLRYLSLIKTHPSTGVQMYTVVGQLSAIISIVIKSRLIQNGFKSHPFSPTHVKLEPSSQPVLCLLFLCPPTRPHKPAS